jgi:hypothetical protein
MSALGTPEHPVRVLFVGGMPRSGSTLLDLMLGQLPAHCDVGELFYMWQAGPVRGQVCACGQPFAECPFWTEVGERAFGGWDSVDAQRVLELQRKVDTTASELRRRLRLGRSDAGLVTEYPDVVTRLYVAIAETSGARVVVDSTKRPSTAWLLTRAPGIDLRVAHIVRDPRGVVNSWNREVALPANSGPRDHLKRRSPRQILRRWVTVNLMIGALQRRVPLLRLRYEDLVSDPRAVMTQVLELVGEPVTPEALSFIRDGAITTGRSHAAAGGRVRLERGELPLRADEKWRTQLPAGLQRVVRVTAGPLMRRYGYR